METQKSVSHGLLKYLLAFLATIAVVLGVTQIPQTGRLMEVDEGDIALSAAYDYPDSQVESSPNNAIPRQCGVNVALVFDMSGSIGDLGRQKSVEAGIGIVEELMGSPVNVGVFNFATEAPSTAPRTWLSRSPSSSRKALTRSLLISTTSKSVPTPMKEPTGKVH